MFFLFLRALIKAWIGIIAICMGLHWMSRLAHGETLPLMHLNAAHAGSRRSAVPSAGITVHITPVGMDARAEQALIEQVLQSPVAQAKLKGARYHVLQSEIGEADPKNRGAQSFRLHVYDYTHDRLIELDGVSSRGSRPVVEGAREETGRDPQPSPEEFRDAVALLAKDPTFGPELAAKELQPYRAMPGSLHSSQDSSTWHKEGRIIEVGLVPTHRGSGNAAPGKVRHEIVGVNLSRGTVIRYPGGAPPTARATRDFCGPDPSGDGTTARGVVGSANITVNQGNTTLWTMTVNRPSISSGYWGSGVELTNVYYRGKRVLSRAGVPIFNVKYDGDTCGPYRDWSWQEHPYTAQGTLIEDGILQADSAPRTIFDNDDDDGNFLGVTIYTQSGATYVESEMEAGWYRYLSQWIFYPDGTIQPRWGFGAVGNSCTCNLHFHHVYWRLDFDIGPTVNNVVESFDGTQWNPIQTESKQYRDPEHQMWRITDPKTGSGYVIMPGEKDGTAADDAYGQGDVWVVLSKPGEIDDSQDYIGTEANIDSFLQGGSVYDQDVVVWYGAHFLHDPVHEGGNERHILGPTFKPINW